MLNKNKKPSSNKIVSVLDIGSSKIVCLIVKIENDKVKVLGTGCHSANGFKGGNISNSKLAKLSIISAVDQAEKNAKIHIENVILSLNGNKIKSHYLQPSLAIKKNKVTPADINKLVTQGVKELEKKGYEVIHYFPLDYIIDNNTGIHDPTGLLGHKLSARLHFVAIESALLENIISTLAACQLNVDDCVFAPYAAGLATLSEVDQELGSILIDFGAGITSYAVFSQKNLFFTGSIPVGGTAITNDIAKSFMIDFSLAERIKTIHGSANIYSNEYELIQYKSSDNNDYEDKNILKSELNQVIHARLEEILTILRNVLAQHEKLVPNAKHNVVITGGGSLLSGITSEITRLFESKTRLGKPITFDKDTTEINASYSAAIGTIQYMSQKKSTKILDSSKGKIWLTQIIQWLKDNF